MRAAFTALFCMLAGATTAVAAAGATNAAWNSGSKGIVAVWIYEKSGTCDELRAGNPQSAVIGTKNVKSGAASGPLPLVIGTKNLKSGASSGPLQVKELNYCILFVSDESNKNPEGVDSNCASGSIDFTYDAKANEYHGKYDITMKNNMVRRGEFRAQFCKPREPVKK